jgi:aspartyl-tRNA(Asn)/glutamyl-tRNA(Gln) amidotransferase subunit C
MIPPMDVTPDLVRHVAHLARLDLTDAEVTAMVPQLARILGHVEAVAKVDVSRAGEAAAAEVVDLRALRPDVPAPGVDPAKVWANAPSHDGAFFLVPRVLEE